MAVPAAGEEREGRSPAAAQAGGTAAGARPRPAAKRGPAEAGPEDLTRFRSETGRDASDPTGTKSFQPAVSGGAGPAL